MTTTNTGPHSAEMSEHTERMSPMSNVVGGRLMVCDPRFRLARVYRRTPAALAVLAEVQAAIDTLDTGTTPYPDERLTVLRTAPARTAGHSLPVRWRQLLRAASRCSDLPASGELAAQGSLPQVWPYLRAAEHDLPWPLAVVLDEYFTEREWIGLGTGRIVFTDGPDRVFKVPFTTAGVAANQIEAAAAEDRSSTVVPIAPCQLVAHPGLPVDLPLLSMARVHIPTVVDLDQLPEWAGEVDDRQLGLHEGRWVAYDLGDTPTA